MLFMDLSIAFSCRAKVVHLLICQVVAFWFCSDYFRVCFINLEELLRLCVCCVLVAKRFKMHPRFDEDVWCSAHFLSSSLNLNKRKGFFCDKKHQHCI